MKLVPIFVDEETGEGLYSVKYKGVKKDELQRLFENWSNVEYVSNYCQANQKFIESEFYQKKHLWIDDIINQILKEADILISQLAEYAKEGFKNGDNLQMLFKPLYKKETSLPVLQKTKAKVVEERKIKHPILRVYGIRIDKNTIIVTGGAIKLTSRMDEHKDTITEEEKIEKVKQFLLANEIKVQDDILNFFADES